MTIEQTSEPGCQAALLTAVAPGAVAAIELIGDVEPVLTALTGHQRWPEGSMRLVPLADIDEGLVARITGETAQLMPHGGLRVVQRLQRWLADNGAPPCPSGHLDPTHLYPEAHDRFDGLALAAVAAAASPLAIDLLLDQPRRWRIGPRIDDADRARSRRLNHLIAPPSVVVAGAANIGKSTLSNALLGRGMSIAADQPGTTRDYTAGRIDLAGLVVNWYDTPGLRVTDDPIEVRATAIASRLIDAADFLIAMTDHQQPWPDLGRKPDLRIAGKCDLGQRNDADLSISSVTGEGVVALTRSVRDALVPESDRLHPGPWIFDERL